jgi:hypothetical protein
MFEKTINAPHLQYPLFSDLTPFYEDSSCYQSRDQIYLVFYNDLNRIGQQRRMKSVSNQFSSFPPTFSAQSNSTEKNGKPKPFFCPTISGGHLQSFYDSLNAIFECKLVSI